MRFGVVLPNVDDLAAPAALVAVAQTAESLGYDSVWTSDHLLLPGDGWADRGCLEALALLGFLAGCTQRVRLGTSVLIAPLREPVLLAKQAATIHALSGGRLVLGLGVGWLESEFDLMEVNYHARASATDTVVECLTVLLTGDEPPRTPRLDAVRAAFSPAVTGDVPLVIGGNSAAALRRAARHGHGWQGVWLEPEEVSVAAAVLRGHGTRPNFEVSLRIDLSLDDAVSDAAVGLNGGAGAVADKVLAYQGCGVDHLIIDFMNRYDHRTPPLQDVLQQLRSFAGLAHLIIPE